MQSCTARESPGTEYIFRHPEPQPRRGEGLKEKDQWVWPHLCDTPFPQTRPGSTSGSSASNWDGRLERRGEEVGEEEPAQSPAHFQVSRLTRADLKPSYENACQGHPLASTQEQGM